MVSDGRGVVLFIYVFFVEYGIHRLCDDFYIFFFSKWLVIDVGTGIVICNLVLVFLV